jgi:acyl carrier protein
VGPRTALEARLAALWAEVLGLPRVGAHDSFFDLGGHSLLAVQLFARIEQQLGRLLPLATLFRAPTVAGLAALLEEQGWAPSWRSLVPLRAAGSRPPFFCVHGIGGNVLSFRALAGHLSTRRVPTRGSSRGRPHARSGRRSGIASGSSQGRPWKRPWSRAGAVAASGYCRSQPGSSQPSPGSAYQGKTAKASHASPSQPVAARVISNA